jgi:antitoxin CptB
MNELELLKKRIKYRSSYRGTKEMDLLLSSFVSKIIDTLSLLELNKLDDFMNCSDEDISNLYSNKNPTISFDDKKILSLFRSHKIK